MVNHLVLDFDDTLLENNLTRAFLERFCRGDRRALLERYQAGEITVEQYNSDALKLVSATPEEVRDFAIASARPRRGLRELVEAYTRLRVHASVISNGFDILIDPVLARVGMRVPRHCGSARFRYVWQASYTDTTGYPVYQGFKEVWVRAFLRAGDRVIYCGDGKSDVDAAVAASYVFARSTLLEHCRAAGLVHQPFESLADIAAGLERVIADLDGRGRDKL